MVKPLSEIDAKARYTISILNNSANPAGAERFVRFLLGSEGQALLQQHGLEAVAPTVSGDAAVIPATIQSLLVRAQ